MAIIDEYKQAVQDVLDGRVPDAPHPGELPNTEDKLAAQSFAAAALAKAMEAGGDGPELFIVTKWEDDDYNTVWSHTVSEIIAAIDSGKIALYIQGSNFAKIGKVSAAPGHYQLNWQYGYISTATNEFYLHVYTWNDTDETPGSSRWHVSMTKE